MTPVLAATQPCFGAISQLRQLDPAASASPAALQQRLRSFLDEMRAKLGAARVPAQDVQDITYALVALADEVAVNNADPLSSFWTGNLLQFHYFRENTAGDGFFERLAVLRADPRRRDALRVYTLSLLFGFQGKYRVRGGELELLTLTQTLEREAFLGATDAEELSPHAARPQGTAGTSRRHLPFLIAAGGALAVAIVLYAGQRFVLGRGVAALEADVAALPRP